VADLALDMSKLRRGYRVEVRWQDSMLLLHGWESAADLVRPASDLGGYCSVGIVMAVDRRRIVLAQSWSGREKHVAGGIAIPRSAITKVRRLRRA